MIVLLGLVKVDGYVIIERNVKLFNINDLKFLIQVGGQLFVEGNQKLIGLDNKLEMVGILKIYRNVALDSLQWLQNPTPVVSDLTICENPSLKTLKDLQNILRQINGSVTIENNGNFEDLKGLDYLIRLKGDMRIKVGNESVHVQCKNLIWVGGDLVLTGVNVLNLDAFQNLQIVGQDLFISESYIWFTNHVTPSLSYVGKHMTLLKTVATGDTCFGRVTTIGGDLVTRENKFGEELVVTRNCINFKMLPPLKTMAGRLDINCNSFSENMDSSDSLENLKSL